MDELAFILSRLASPDMLPSLVGLFVAMTILLLAFVMVRGLRAREALSHRVSASAHVGGVADRDARSLGTQGRLTAERVLLKASKIVVPNERDTLTEMRKTLINAGFFSQSSVPLYFAIRIAAALGSPLVGILFASALPGLPNAGILLLASALSALGLVVPPIFLDIRKSRMRDLYRNTFPDLMDILVVCVEAGQSLQGAIERVSREIVRTCPQLGANLHIVSLELRAGRDLNGALMGLADRLGIDEVRSLTLLLKQSEELGTSLAGTLRVYSDEMRDKRLMRAEAKANALPVKMVIPLGLFMFPVILVVIMLPLVVRLSGVLI